MRQLFVILVLVGAAGAAWGESSLTTELAGVATRYHENPARGDTVRETLEQAAGAKPEVDTFVALAHVCFIWGDVRAATAEQKLEAYDEGRQAARRALERVPGILGGDLDIAEQMFMRVSSRTRSSRECAWAPGKTLITQGRITDPRRELQTVLEEKAPTNPADWALKDAQEAWALLESVRSKSS